MTARQEVSALARQTGAAASLFFKDIGQGLLLVSHNTLALLGLALVVLGTVFWGQADVRHRLEMQALDWLNARQEARAEAEGDTLVGASDVDAAARATVADLHDLSRQQAAVTQYLARRYHVAPEPVARLVQEAWTAGHRAHVEPTLILSVMAVESGFNPFAQSAVGAQGLMQVLTRVHDDKYAAFGGTQAAFDPVSNLRVGVQVLKDCIDHSGGVEDGLRCYVGAANLGDDAGYAARVLAENEQMNAAVGGGHAPAQVAQINLSVPARPAAATSAAQAQLALR
ncbi:MAG: lytic transglycosylase domain-containing protein [Pelomonas sp.]|nr:lytic transglycosylase domain-containing protein [Roseateles sp.]